MVKALWRLIVCGVCIFVFGFVAYWLMLPAPVTQLHGKLNLDAYAVFTGGEGRVAYGLQTLQSHTKPMLITGIHPETSLTDLLQKQIIDADTLALLTLDHTAQTTRQNMDVLHTWATTAGMTHVGVITSHYHWPRVWVLGKLHAPELNIMPLVVEYSTSPMFYLREYVKLWAVLFLK